MKRMMMIAAIMVAVVSVHAQEAGQMYYKIMFGGAYTNVTGGKDTKMKAGLVFGPEISYKASDKLALTGGLLYSMQGNKVKDAVDGTLKNNLEYLNVPVLANFYVHPQIALKVGAQVGYLVRAKCEGESFKDQCNKVDFSIPFGIAWEQKDGFVIEARYSLGLTNVMKKDIVGKNNRNSVFMVSLAYKIK